MENVNLLLLLLLSFFLKKRKKEEDIEDICLFVCKMKFYFIEWALKTVFSRVA
jgi:hypothetical protein